MPDGSAAPPLRILLVEEQAAARDLVTLALERLRYRIESVATGSSALAVARRDPADLILLSTTLPDMPGAPLIGAFRELPALERVPIVAICQGVLRFGRPARRPARRHASVVRSRSSVSSI